MLTHPAIPNKTPCNILPGNPDLLNFELIKPDNYNELIADLQIRTGIPKIDRIDIKEIDFQRNNCHLRIFYETKDKNQ